MRSMPGYGNWEVADMPGVEPEAERQYEHIKTGAKQRGAGPALDLYPDLAAARPSVAVRSRRCG
jgi:hypothetical protein